MKIFSNIPLNIRHLSHGSNKMKLALKKFLLAGSAQSCNEYFGWSLSIDMISNVTAM